jgi:hypothetical protein
MCGSHTAACGDRENEVWSKRTTNISNKDIGALRPKVSWRWTTDKKTCIRMACPWFGTLLPVIIGPRAKGAAWHVFRDSLWLEWKTTEISMFLGSHVPLRAYDILTWRARVPTIGLIDLLSSSWSSTTNPEISNTVTNDQHAPPSVSERKA